MIWIWPIDGVRLIDSTNCQLNSFMHSLTLGSSLADYLVTHITSQCEKQTPRQQQQQEKQPKRRKNGYFIQATLEFWHISTQHFDFLVDSSLGPNVNAYDLICAVYCYGWYLWSPFRCVCILHNFTQRDGNSPTTTKYVFEAGYNTNESHTHTDTNIRPQSGLNINDHFVWFPFKIKREMLYTNGYKTDSTRTTTTNSYSFLIRWFLPFILNTPSGILYQQNTADTKPG